MLYYCCFQGHSGAYAHAGASYGVGGGHYAPAAHAGRSPQPKREAQPSPATSSTRNQLLNGRNAENIQMKDMSPKRPSWQKDVNNLKNILLVTLQRKFLKNSFLNRKIMTRLTATYENLFVEN